MSNYISEKDIDFAKSFENFVNGPMHTPQTVAAQMARSHRYLQQQMFKVCYEYIRILAMMHQHNRTDPRNEWACETAHKMLSNIDEPDLAIRPYEWDNYCELDHQLYYKNL